MAEPGDQTAAPTAGRGQFRTARADREQAIEVLKTAFVEDRLTKDELDLRVGQALASRTYAELAAATSDLPALPAVPRPVAPRPAAGGSPGTPARTLAKAAQRSGVCMLSAFAITGIVALAHSERLVFLAILALVAAAIAASGFLGYGVIDAWQEHRSRRQLPPRPGRSGRGLEGERPDSTGRDPARPGAGPGQTLTDMRTHRPRSGRPRGMRPVPGAA